MYSIRDRLLRGSRVSAQDLDGLLDLTLQFPVKLSQLDLASLWRTVERRAEDLNALKGGSSNAAVVRAVVLRVWQAPVGNNQLRRARHKPRQEPWAATILVQDDGCGLPQSQACHRTPGLSKAKLHALHLLPACDTSNASFKRLMILARTQHLVEVVGCGKRLSKSLAGGGQLVLVASPVLVLQEVAHLEGTDGVHLEPRPSRAATASRRTSGPAHEAPQEPLLAAGSSLQPSLQPRLARLHEAQAFRILGLRALIVARRALLVPAAIARLPHGAGSAVTAKHEDGEGKPSDS